MSTLTEAAAACCACIRVRWVTTPGPDGTVSGRWVCSACEREFEPREVAYGRGVQEGTRAQMSAILYTVGGTVEGLPTQSINYLQRLRQLVETEKSVELLRAELDKSRADYIKDQAEIASLRIDVADARNQRDQCHLRAQAAELANESLQRRVTKLDEVLERVARCLVTPNPAITDTLWLDPSPRGPHITLYEFVCGHLGREVKANG